MSGYTIHEERLARIPTAAMKATLSPAEMPRWFADAFEATETVAASQGAPPNGPPYARYHVLDGGRFEVEAGFPVPHPITTEGPVYPSELPEGLAARTTHVGPYERLGEAYRSLEVWVTEHGGEITGDPWEIDLSDPEAQPDPATWRTDVVMPFRKP